MANKNIQLKTTDGQDLLFPKTLVDNIVEINDATGTETSLTSLLSAKAARADVTALQTKMGNSALTGFDTGITTVTDALNDLNDKIKKLDSDDAIFTFKSTDGSLYYDKSYDSTTGELDGLDIKIQYVNPDCIYFSDSGNVKIEDGNLIQVDKKRLFDSGIRAEDIIFSEEI